MKQSTPQINAERPLSSPQQEIWLDQILHPDSLLYTIGGYVQIDGPVDVMRFAQALEHVIQQNDSLCSVLIPGEPLPTQQVVATLEVDLDYHDFSGQAKADEYAQAWMERTFAEPFQLYHRPLFHFALLKAAANRYYWLKKYHHVIIDGWGITLVIQRTAAAYNALVSEQPLAEEPQPSYLDFIADDQAYVASAQFQHDAAYWREKYQTLPDPLLPRRHSEHVVGQVIPSHLSRLYLSQEFFDEIQAFAEQQATSPFQVILGALYCYFVRIAQRDDVVVGMPVLNRRTTAFRQTVGHFTNVIPVWYQFGAELTFLDLLQAMNRDAQQGAEHRRFPLGEVNRQVKLAQANRSQLFDVTLPYLSGSCDVQFGESPVTFRLMSAGFTQSLTIRVEKFHTQGDVPLLFDSTGMFTADEIEQMQQRLEFLLGEVMHHPTTPIRQLQIMPEAERQQILVEWNNTAADYPSDRCIHQLFEEQVARTPDAIAVVCAAAMTSSLTYRDLNARANQLARYLQTLGVGPETLVGICIERSIEMVVGILGILKAGGAYVPLDPDYPADRLTFMLEDARVAVLLTQQHLAAYLPAQQARVVCLDADWQQIAAEGQTNPDTDVTPDNLAYVIYTSGSTGQPKGVLLEHRGLCNRAAAQSSVYAMQPHSRLLNFASLSFDVATADLVMAWCSGATLYVAPKETLLPGLELVQTLQQLAITHLEATVSVWAAMPYAELPALETLIVGGEACSAGLIQQWAPGRRFFNAYGPTETTIIATLAECSADEQKPSIGRPLNNVQIYILDRYRQPVPIGTPGELYIGGVGVARGYLNRPELTQEKFIPNPFGEGRLYRTGDLACWRADGAIEFLGRSDQQVKLRGFRIELGEIEATLARYAAVREAVAVLYEADSSQRLAAYVTLQGEADETVAVALKEYLKQRLPDYMVPAHIQVLDRLPLTPNGKVDRQALPAPGAATREEGFEAPATPTEELLAGLWASLLKRDGIGRGDDFFALGGHSLLVTQVAARIREQFQLELPLRVLFQQTTLAKLALYLETTQLTHALQEAIPSPSAAREEITL